MTEKIRYQWGRKHVIVENLISAVVARLPLAVRRAAIVDAAVRATRPDVIGPDAYAGPDGLDYKRLWESAALPR